MKGLARGSKAGKSGGKSATPIFKDAESVCAAPLRPRLLCDDGLHRRRLFGPVAQLRFEPAGNLESNGILVGSV